MAVHREIEVKLGAPELTELPDLTTLSSVAAADPPFVVDLDAVYLDTADRRLAIAGITLRRRTGGADAGWHLKLHVGADERAEIHAPLGGTEVPDELVAPLRSRLRGASVVPALSLATRREVHRLRDAAGALVAEVADDTVRAHDLTAPAGLDSVQTWREWEVELVSGDRALLAEARALLRSAGGENPWWSSKALRAMGVELPYGRPAGRRGLSAAEVLGRFLRAARDELAAWDVQLRRSEPDALHQMRVTVRELRSALGTFRELLGGDLVAELRDELGWLGGVLGAARDAEVVRDLIAGLVAVEPVGLVRGPVARRLDEDRADAHLAAMADVVHALDSDRYAALLDALDGVAAAPPFSALASEPAAKVLPGRVRHEWGRLEKALEAASSTPSGGPRDQALHEARKAAKRARYSAEVLVPAVGRAAARSARAAQELQTLLGDHHDTVTVRDVLDRVAIDAARAGEDTFTYGRLHGIAQARAERLETQLPAASERAGSGRQRRWMRRPAQRA
jgi:CHAD domain-containing protein